MLISHETDIAAHFVCRRCQANAQPAKGKEVMICEPLHIQRRPVRSTFHNTMAVPTAITKATLRCGTGGNRGPPEPPRSSGLAFPAAIPSPMCRSFVPTRSSPGRDSMEVRPRECADWVPDFASLPALAPARTKLTSGNPWGCPAIETRRGASAQVPRSVFLSPRSVATAEPQSGM